MNVLTFSTLTLALLGLLASQRERTPSKPQILSESSFTVIGISARTTNAQEMSGRGVIGKMWQRFMSEQILAKIPNRADSNTLALYTDYESDATGAYTFVLGAKVTSDAKIPDGMVAVKVPAGKYSVFTTDRGPTVKVVPAAWARIWSLSKSQLGGQRAYKTDFELYGPEAADPQNAQVQIHVGIK
jgi:predicted transcriptional regulator YdeE